ncbi:MAG: gfo/Idh/MocA family oxidoreductase [Planctomycetota bacterium]|nr:MAG: gfo/Idh/MocA family oxidoreductase [Planctomycetota bacterium]
MSRITPSAPLRVGVIGLGMGRGHVANFNKHSGCRVVAICDLDTKRCQLVQAEHQVDAVYDNADTMLAEARLDVVAIATPNILHHPLTLKAFTAGCHVLCEKPMAMNSAQAEEMRDAARAAQKRLMINFSYRFNEQSWALRQHVDDGHLGEVYFARTSWHRRRGMPGFGGWFGRKEMSGGGPLIDLGVHRIDLALWLMGYPNPTWIMGATYDHIARPLAEAESKAFDVEDLATALIRFDNGATLQVEASWAAHIGEAELMETRLLGTRGGLVQRNVNGGYSFEAQMFHERHGAQYDTTLIRQPAATSSMEHFIDCIIHDRPHQGDAEHGLIVQRILDGIYQSAASGEPIQLCHTTTKST